MNNHYLGLGHIAIHTKDLEASIAFYEKLGGTLAKRAVIHLPAGEKLLALVSFAGITLELIQSPTEVPMTEGCIPHFAIYVDDLDAAAAAVKAAGVDTFLTPSKNVLPNIFDGVENWFFTGPSGEQIELLHTL